MPQSKSLKLSAFPEKEIVMLYCLLKIQKTRQLCRAVSGIGPFRPYFEKPPKEVFVLFPILIQRDPESMINHKDALILSASAIPSAWSCIALLQ